jgi:hypothetical protein
LLFDDENVLASLEKEISERYVNESVFEFKRPLKETCSLESPKARSRVSDDGNYLENRSPSNALLQDHAFTKGISSVSSPRPPTSAIKSKMRMTFKK